MSRLRAAYSDGYTVPLPEGHRFPMGKFLALRKILERDRIIGPDDIIEPTEAAWEDLALVHTPRYLYKLRHGELGRAEERRMGLPWSPALVRRSRLAARGTVNAAWMALEDGVAANLAGGTHHAFPDHGEGFCVLNDVGVAVRVLRRGGWIRRALVVDLDVHQGNGTAAVFADDPETFTFSMHGAGNYPFRPTPSDLDVALGDGTGDDEYEEQLRRVLPEVVSRSRPDVVFYLGGVDVVAGDRFGRLALTPAGLERRDRFVIETVRGEGLPLALLLSGGYADTPERTAELHAIAHRTALEVEAAARARVGDRPGDGMRATA